MIAWFFVFMLLITGYSTVEVVGPFSIKEDRPQRSEAVLPISSDHFSFKEVTYPTNDGQIKVSVFEVLPRKEILRSKSRGMEFHF